MGTASYGLHISASGIKSASKVGRGLAQAGITEINDCDQGTSKKLVCLQMPKRN